MKKFKGFITGLMCGAILMISVPVMAKAGKQAINVVYNNIKLEVNGIRTKMPQGVEPFIYNGTTYLPVRAVAEALGEEVNYDKQTATVQVGSNKPNDKANFPLVRPDLIPSGAKLDMSSVKPGVEEYYDYKYKVYLEDGAFIETVGVCFNENFEYSIEIRGKDKNGEILSFEWTMKTQSINYYWQIPDISAEDKRVLVNIAKQFAAAYGQ